MSVVDFSANAWQASAPGLNQGLGRRAEALNALAQGLQSLAGSANISGQGADGMRAYIGEVHQPIIRSLSIAVSTFQTAIGVYWSGYTNVDNDGNFRLVKDELDTHLTQLDAGMVELEGFAMSLREIASDVAHLVYLGGAGANAVDTTVSDFESLKTIATNQSNDWVAYETSDPGFKQVKELLTKLKSVVRNFDALTGGRGRAYQSGGFSLTFAELGALTDPMEQYCEDNYQVASDGWDSMFAEYAKDVAAAEEQARKDQAVGDLLWDALQIMAGAAILVIGVAGSPFTAGASLALTIAGGALIVGGVNSAINHVSIATSGNDLNLIGNVVGAATQWYDSTLGQPAQNSGNWWLGFAGGLGSAVLNVAGGGLGASFADAKNGLVMLATDPQAQAALMQQIATTWNGLRSGDGYVVGQVTGGALSVLVPGALALKGLRAAKKAEVTLGRNTPLNGAEVDKIIDDLKSFGSTPKPNKKGTTQVDMLGGYDQALKDFERFAVGVEKVPKPGGSTTVVELLDGRKINVRPNSSPRNSGPPTIEIQYPDGPTLKFRYLK